MASNAALLLGRAPVYERHRPETTALYEVVRDNLVTLYAAIEGGALDVRLPKHARKELDAYLDCGLQWTRAVAPASTSALSFDKPRCASLDGCPAPRAQARTTPRPARPSSDTRCARPSPTTASRPAPTASCASR